MQSMTICSQPKVLKRGWRLKVRHFKYAQDGHKFLNTGDNGLKWRETKAFEPTKTGTYVYAGEQWHNVKTMDPCVLAHI